MSNFVVLFAADADATRAARATSFIILERGWTKKEGGEGGRREKRNGVHMVHPAP
jgi:hypothetical protein